MIKPPLVGNRRLLLEAFIFVGVLSAPAADQIDEIASALRNREFDHALARLRPALAAMPHNAQLWAMQGIAYSGEGENKQALASFQRALRISPNYLPALHGAAQIQYEAGNPAAIPLLEHILRLHPGDSTGHGMLAVAEYQQGNCKAALPHFAKADMLFSSQPSALRAYGICLAKLKQLEQAVGVFERVIALEPEDVSERHVLASLQLMDHKPEDAIRTLQSLLATGHSSAATLELASAAYEDAHDTPQAVSLLRQAILEEPRNVNLYLDFAYLSAAHDSFQVGIDAVTDGIGQQPNSASLYFARGALQVQLSQYEQAEADFEKAYQLDPSQSLSAAAQGMAAVQANDLNRALSGVRTKLARNPNDPLLLYLEADILSQKGAEPGTPEFQTAMRSAKRAVMLQPRLAPARAVLAKLYMQTEQNQQAVEQCRRALDIDPKDQTSLYRLIQALRKTGQTSEIPDLLKRLAQLREQTTKEERERYRYKLVEDATQP
ncbi:MAG: tetratricopeptide repeat protein [Acidobacteria bacterium]|nr:tetratricopeptide repeat protein [Acidobacteriota bacterium]